MTAWGCRSGQPGWTESVCSSARPLVDPKGRATCRMAQYTDVKRLVEKKGVWNEAAGAEAPEFVRRRHENYGNGTITEGREM